MLVSQIGRELCLQQHIILNEISNSGASDSIIVSQESGRWDIDILIFSPTPDNNNNIEIISADKSGI